MLSLELIRNDPEFVRQTLLRRGEYPPIERIVELDARRRQVIFNGDELRAKRNEASKRIGAMRDKPSDLIDEVRRVGDEIKSLEKEEADIGAALRELLLELPNLPDDCCAARLGRRGQCGGEHMGRASLL